MGRSKAWKTVFVVLMLLAICFEYTKADLLRKRDDGGREKIDTRMDTIGGDVSYGDRFKNGQEKDPMHIVRRNEWTNSDGDDFEGDFKKETYLFWEQILESSMSLESTAPTSRPTFQPTTLPTSLPTFSPSDRSAAPTEPSTLTPSDTPSENTNPLTTVPSSRPSLKPSDSSRAPTALPSPSPETASPSSSPSNKPSSSPSSSPSTMPSAGVFPTSSPNQLPSLVPTESIFPTMAESTPPSLSAKPTNSRAPSTSQFPSMVPTEAPSVVPSYMPSILPSKTMAPTEAESAHPTFSGTPSISPSEYPSQSPSNTPSESPSETPSEVPSSIPTSAPQTMLPSAVPTPEPTRFETILSLQNEVGICDGASEGIGCADPNDQGTTGNPNDLVNCFDVTNFGASVPFFLDAIRFWIGDSIPLPTDLSIRLWEGSPSLGPSGGEPIFTQQVDSFGFAENVVELSTTLELLTTQICVGLFSENPMAGLRVQTEPGLGDNSFVMAPECNAPDFLPLEGFGVSQNYCIEAFIFGG